MKNKIEFIFRFYFSWMNWKVNCLKRSGSTLCLFSQTWSTRYSKASLCQVKRTPRICCVENSRCALSFHYERAKLRALREGAQGVRARKARNLAHSSITGCYFHIYFVLLVLKIISAKALSSYCPPKSVPQVTHKLFKNRIKVALTF